MKPATILVMHHDPLSLEKLVSMLRDGGYTALPAGSAASAAGQLDGEVDLILLELKQSGLDRGALRRALSLPDEAEPDSLEAAERRHLSLVLRHTGGNKRRAALILGISRSTLLNKVRKYGLDNAR